MLQNYVGIQPDNCSFRVKTVDSGQCVDTASAAVTRVGFLLRSAGIRKLMAGCGMIMT